MLSRISCNVRSEDDVRSRADVREKLSVGVVHG